MMYSAQEIDAHKALTFGLASDSAYIWKMIEENKTGTVRPLNELPKMDMH